MNIRTSSKRFLKLVLPVLVAAFVPASPGTAQVLVSLDFETAGDVANNFRALSVNNASFTQTSNGVANDSMSVTSTGVSGLRSFIYDTTPANATVQNTFSGSVLIEGDIDTTGSTTSFGIYLLNPAGEATGNQLLSLFNWDSSGTNDLLRLFKTSSVTSGSASGQHYTSGNVNAGTNVADGFTHYALSYRADTVDSTQAVLNLTVGSFSTGDIFMGTGTYFSTYEIGFRFSPNGSGQTVFLDNFSVTQIPEPSTVTLAVLGLLGLVLLRRKPFRT